MRRYYKNTLDLINIINDESKNKPIENCIITHKDNFASIAKSIKTLSVYKKNIKPTVEKYELKMKEKYEKEKIKEQLFIIYYLDLCKKLKESCTSAHQLMVICVIIPLIDKEIILMEEKNGN